MCDVFGKLLLKNGGWFEGEDFFKELGLWIYWREEVALLQRGGVSFRSLELIAP